MDLKLVFLVRKLCIKSALNGFTARWLPSVASFTARRPAGDLSARPLRGLSACQDRES
jgi:hypothetical protein